MVVGWRNLVFHELSGYGSSMAYHGLLLSFVALR